jgi:O-acetyl-ADP-ribose deacetylase (regulator of RNase III)
MTVVLGGVNENLFSTETKWRLMMAIVYKNGDILQDDADWLVCPTNTVGVMGAGLAKQFKEKYPGYYAEYKEFCDENTLTVARPVFHWRGFYVLGGGEVERNIVSFATKRRWSEDSKIEYIKTGLNQIVSDLREIYDNDYWYKDEFKSIAFPKLGAGLGKLPWDDVHELLKEFAEKLPEVEVRIYI